MRLSLLVLRSQDIDAAARLYGLLGMDFVKHSHGQGPLHYTSESLGFVFEIYPLKADQQSTISTRIGFEVDSVEAAVESLTSHGGRLLQPPSEQDGIVRAVVQDLDGHKIQLSSRRASTTQPS